MHASWRADVTSSGRRCVRYQNGWTDPKDSACVSRQQHGIGTQNPGDVTACPPLETYYYYYQYCRDFCYFVLFCVNKHICTICIELLCPRSNNSWKYFFVISLTSPALFLHVQSALAHVFISLFLIDCNWSADWPEDPDRHSTWAILPWKAAVYPS